MFRLNMTFYGIVSMGISLYIKTAMHTLCDFGYTPSNGRVGLTSIVIVVISVIGL